mmetsp:Transcript_61628/g.107950  ORF Transcript_61628/g.107950 Transcript_61628/m.107950 type:complete len:281 (-) Transcript_61628:1826-2668(-)
MLLNRNNNGVIGLGRTTILGCTKVRCLHITRSQRLPLRVLHQDRLHSCPEKGDDQLPKKGEDSTPQTHQPFRGAQRPGLEKLIDSFTSTKSSSLDHQNLDTGTDSPDHAEGDVVLDALENVVFMIKLPAVDPVRQLHEDEAVKNQRIMNGGICMMTSSGARRNVHQSALWKVPVFDIDSQRSLLPCAPEEQENEHHKLVDRLAQDIAAHFVGEKGLVPAIGCAVEKVLSRRFVRQGKSSQRIHDEIHPQHLHHRQWVPLHHHGSQNSNGDSADIHGELKL